jgi:hypothetical protein
VVLFDMHIRTFGPYSVADRRALSTLNRMHLVLFDMQSRTFGPYLAAIHRILTSLMILTRHVLAGRQIIVDRKPKAPTLLSCMG